MTAHEALKQCRDALALAHAICDRVPARWHELSPSSFPTEHDIGRMVNWQPDGSHGYALIREALAAADAALSAAPESDGYTVDAVAWEGFLILREMLADTREVFDANGSETPQVVRDVIEFVVSWIDVYTGKTGEQKHG